MGKKLLFIVGSIFIGIVLALTSWYSGLYLEYQRHVTEYIVNGDYTSAERYYAYALDAEKVYSAKQTDETHIEVFYAVNTKAKDVYGTKNELLGTYDAYYKTIQISMFNLSSDFNISSDTKCKVVAVVNDKNIEFPFISDNANYYDDYLTYGFFNLTIYEDEYNALLLKNGLSASSEISSFKIVDNSNGVKYELVLESGINFNNSFHNFVENDLITYNEKAEKSLNSSTLNLTDTSELKELNLDHITTRNENYLTYFTIDSVKTSSRFVTVFIISIFVIIGLDLGLAVLIFKKKPVETIITAEVVEEVEVDTVEE